MVVKIDARIVHKCKHSVTFRLVCISSQAMHVLLALTRSYLKGKLHIYLHASDVSTASLSSHACMLQSVSLFIAFLALS